MKHEILLFPDPRLRQKASRTKRPLPAVAEALRDSVPEYALGLAATQLGINRRAILLQIEKPEILWNPQIRGLSSRITSNEGCLSLPGELYEIKRFESVELRARDENWQMVWRVASGLEALVLQHETDHLRGILVCDRGRKITPLPEEEVE